MNTWQSIIFYFFIFSISGYFIYLGNVSKKKITYLKIKNLKIKLNWYVIIGLFIPIIVGCLRYGIGTDYASYLEIYRYCTIDSSQISNHWVNSVEPMFKWLAKLSYVLSDTPLIFFGVPWIATVLFSYFGLRKLAKDISAKRTALAWLIILSIIIPIGFNQIRQTLAIAIMFFATNYILEDKRFSNLKYIIATILAILCHKSAIIMMPLYFIGYFIRKKENINTKKVNLIILIFGSAAIFLAVTILLVFKWWFVAKFGNISYVNEFYRLTFLNNGKSVIDLRPDNLIVFTIFLFPIFSIQYINVKTSFDKLLMIFVYIGLTISLLSLFIMNGERTSQYFLLYAPVAFFLLVPRMNLKRLMLYPVIIFAMVMVLGWQTVTYYHTIFNSNVDINKINQLQVRPLYNQILYIMHLRGGNSLEFYDKPPRIKADYKEGFLWKLK